MNNSVVINSVSSSNTLTFSESDGLNLPPGKEYFRATLTGDKLSASAKVYAYQPHGKITNLFDYLATNWRGWTGTQQWASIEGELTLKCTWQKSGKVNIETTLLSGHYDDDWSAQLIIYVEPNQLDQISSKVKQFFLIPDSQNQK